MPDGVMSVCRPYKWGNPLVGMNAGGWYAAWLANPRKYLVDVLTTCHARNIPMKIHPAYDHLRYVTADYYSQDLAELRGRDLACWCPVGGVETCHADVLLELANK